MLCAADEGRTYPPVLSIRVANYDRSKKFYEAALAPLGYTLGTFWIKQGEPVSVGAPGLRPEYHPNYYGVRSRSRRVQHRGRVPQDGVRQGRGVHGGGRFE